MKRRLPAAIALGSLLALGAAPPDPGIYKSRRDLLARSAPDAVIVLFGAPDIESHDLRARFYQDPNFYYLTGWQEPDAILLLESGRETLFLPNHSSDVERWNGRRESADDAGVREITGFDNVLPVTRFESRLHAALEQKAKIFSVGDTAISRLRALAPMRDVLDAAPILARRRMRKSPEEVALLQQAADVTIAAHRAVWKTITPGRAEYQIGAELTSIFLDRGCERDAYAPILASGPNSVYPHYRRNRRVMQSGDLVVIDAGAECGSYAADVTRTIPVSGKFTARQRELYEIVLGAQQAAIAAVKPGVPVNTHAPNSLYRIAYDYFNSHGKDLHGKPLGKYFIHGISHLIGLDVHDAGDLDTLEEGMVISVEPGIYIPEEQIGIRIEDMVLVTSEGARVLTAALPRDPSQIEEAVGP